MLLTDIAAGIAPVQTVAVVEVERGLQGRLRIRGPLQDLLGPVHAHEPVQLAFRHQLHLQKTVKKIVKMKVFFNSKN